MKIILNHKETTVPSGTTLGRLLELNSIPAVRVAVAVNEKVVPKSLHYSHELFENDNVIVIKAFYGG
ncbi:MAG: sulfur carrier protein ThiS [Firmicutes bacterium]|nr:sulfur carrier protein ThiS [Bacillota bacterium]MCM1401393.1 sulfur carrier protein ThiS [Bacteroides sp.]MCM1477337.1 sulfur carrier protein ThiS [Bacteroides sp.]